MAAPGKIGSLTGYWRSRDKIGIANPPAESIADVDPTTAEILRPFDRQFTNGEHVWSSFLILPICKINTLKHVTLCITSY